jgi:hypothetical protein
MTSLPAGWATVGEVRGPPGPEGPPGPPPVIHVGPQPPPSPAPGTLWLDTS